LVHLSREVEKRADKRPQLSDLRDSGNIEQDADLVLFPFYENYYFGETNLKIRNYDNIDNKRYSEIIIGKHRNGATNNVMLGYYAEYYSFYNLDNQLNIIF
jgi:replicative DNA helicase